jgi:CRP-like cAMP-binding protein
LEDLVALSVQERLVRVLLELGEEHGIQEDAGLRIDLPLSLRDIAETVGCSQQTTSAALRALAKRGLVKLAWPTLFILDPGDLGQSG